MTTDNYDVSLRVRHLTLNADVICDGVGLPPSRKWSVGEQRSTPKGKILEGCYKESYCSFKLSHGTDESLSEFLMRITSGLKNNASFKEKIISSGCDIEYFIGWYITKNTGDTFNQEFLKDIATLGISLAFDIYPSE
ncbi:MAG: hypothetical protein ABW168_14005 [Sedimenticola sp.]